MRVEFVKKLAVPAEVKEMYPLTGNMAESVSGAIKALENVFEILQNEIQKL